MARYVIHMLHIAMHIVHTEIPYICITIIILNFIADILLIAIYIPHFALRILRTVCL